MKTKIIYISGGEVFNMADIRAAFDTVRDALSLDNETVLFGVPIDNDDAFAVDKSDTPVESAFIDDSVEIASNVNDDVVVSAKIDTPELAPEPEPVIEKPKKTAHASRAKVIPITTATTTPDSTTQENEPSTNDGTAIPILSVLGATSDDQTSNDSTTQETANTPVAAEDLQPKNTTVMQPDAQSVTISDMLADDTTPVDNHEKTLEELLESMTPLGEDEKTKPTPVAETEPVTETTPAQTTNDDTDATLELLAAEFAESADKIVTPRPETRSKIGKLKNILPFKKVKKQDNGIMGDLFGWAGVANDEDFTIPGFFANATKK